MRLLALLLTGVLTLMVMSISMHRGRLAVYPKVDDVIYMARGAELWHAGHDGWVHDGAAGMLDRIVRDWRKNPPHAPWASGCAAMGFGVFGVKDWAAYAFTAVPVLAFLLATGRVARRAGGRWGWRSGLLMVFAASAPFLAASVQNLKPDYCAGITTAIGIMVLLRGPLLTARWQRLAWAGLWFGAALLAKPAMLLATGMLCAGTLGTCVVRDLVIAGRNVRWSWSVARGFRACAIVAGVASAIALPHYWFAFGKVWIYSTGILDGEEWAFRGSMWDRIWFYLTGPGGRLMLDGGRTLLGLVAVIGWCGWMAMQGHSRRRVATMTAMLVVLGMAWAGPTLARAMISQFAAVFAALLWLVVVHGLSLMVRRPRRRTDLPAEILGWFMVLVLVGTWRVTFPMLPIDEANPRRAAWSERAACVRNVYVAIRTASAGRAHTRVLLAGSPSDLGPPLITFWSIQDAERWTVRELRRIPAAPGEDGATQQAIARAHFDESDVVVVYEPDVSILRPKEVTAGSDAFYLLHARTDTELRLVERVEDGISGNGIEVYERVAAKR